MYAETGKWDADLGLKDGELVDTSATHRYNTEMSRLQGDLDAVTGKMKESMSARTKRMREVKSELAPERTRLTELQTKLRGVPDAATLQTNKTQLEADLATLESQITARQQAVATAEADLQRLLGKKRVAKKKRAAHNAAIRSARGRVQGHKATLQGYESAKQRHLTGIATIDQQLQMHSELPVAQAKVSRLEGILNQLNPSTHTRAYNKLQQMITNYQTNYSTIEGRTVNWDMSEILRNAGIRNAFKHGGSINRSKINKFLNYAKR
jgi:chromosome segregation ATPase